MLMPLQMTYHLYAIKKMPSSINCDRNEEWSTFEGWILFSYFNYLAKVHNTKYKVQSTKIHSQATGSRPVRHQDLTSVTYVFTRVKNLES